MESPISAVEYRVPYADTDKMGVVYYGNYLTYFERARSQALRDLGLPYTVMEEQGTHLPVIEAHVNYLQPAHYEDLLSISARFEIAGPVRIKAHCEVRRGDELLAHGYTVHVCFSTATQRPARLPEELARRLRQPGSG